MVNFLKSAMSLASNFLCCLIQGPEAKESSAPCRSGSRNHSQPRAISIEEYETMHNEVCVLESEGHNVILSRPVTYKKEENGGKVTCMEFEKYMISKRDLEDWEKRKVHVTIEEDIEEWPALRAAANSQMTGERKWSCLLRGGSPLLTLRHFPVKLFFVTDSSTLFQMASLKRIVLHEGEGVTPKVGDKVACMFTNLRAAGQHIHMYGQTHPRCILILSVSARRPNN